MHERASAGWTRAAEHAANQHTAALWLSFFLFCVSHLRSGRHAHVATQNGQTALARTAGMDPTPNLVVYGRDGRVRLRLRLCLHAHARGTPARSGWEKMGSSIPIRVVEITGSMGPLLFFDRQRSSDVGDGRFSEGGGCERPGSIVTAAQVVPFRRLSPACGGISGERRHLERF